MEKIMSAVKTIMAVILNLNTLFDKNRNHLAKLEKALNGLGNPGCDFKSVEFFYEYSDDGQDKWWFYLAFDHGKICVVESGYHQNSECSKKLSEMSLSMVDAMLKQLPYFLEEYQKFLVEKEEAYKMTLDTIVKIVEAINSVINK